jgi:hypothetical protein
VAERLFSGACVRVSGVCALTPSTFFSLLQSRLQAVPESKITPEGGTPTEAANKFLLCRNPLVHPLAPS